MTALEKAALRQLALKVLAERAGPAAGADALAAAARGAYDDLAHALAPLIGQVGVDALTARALHLAQHQYPWLVQAREGTPAETKRTPGTPLPEQVEAPFTEVVGLLTRRDPAVAAEAAGLMLATLAGLLVTFIGERLTGHLLRQAWPDAFSGAHTEET